jgi:septal ring factor EnvC (AmiA/AmiB activator)
MFLKKQGFQSQLTMKEFRLLCFVVSFLFIAGSSIAQNRKQLEEQRSKIIEQIEQTSKSLEATKSNKKATLKDLKTIENQIKKRKELIQNIQEQIRTADNAIALNDTKIDSLNHDLLHLDNQFKQLARNMYLREKASNKWAYILSASSVNNAFLRWRYNKQYEAFTRQKTEQVTTIKGNISTKTHSILEEKNYVELLLKDEKKNFTQLEKDQKKKDEILTKLKAEETSLRADLSMQKKQREHLNQGIEKIIIAELSKKRESKSSTSSGSIARKKLIWPAKGYISGKFGSQRHPTLKNVKINNNGIDITCKKSEAVSVVADGVVIGITSIPGYDNMVIVQHGKYYSVYSKLAQVIVKKEDQLKAGQTLGKLNDSEAPELHFEFWEEKKKLDPQKWLK